MNSSQRSGKPFLRALSGATLTRPPFWLMRQAGRYLPEYRELRGKAGSFLDLVYQPALAAEVTLQPLRRYGMDAAILFSDILVVPHALGRAVRFETGEGPKLDPLRQGSSLPILLPGHFNEITEKIYETVRRIRSGMAAEGFDQTALIGFAGSPFTVACYMVEGGGSRDFIETKRWAYSDPEGFGALIDLLVDATVRYLDGQIQAGAEAVQLFDSWAGILDETQFRRWVIAPTRKITAALRANYPDLPIIGFPKGAGCQYQAYVRDSGVTAVSIDPSVPLRWAAAALQPTVPVQGNMDPICLLADTDAIDMALEHIYSHLSLGPFVFNLGHGVNKDTPPANVDHLARRIREWQG